ncbi:unnamed protein product [Schistosoma curassoni]|uniref:C-type lectin domain-containing protein n=1 Tax=Schistosoma curassoni TaxID=6186 RepID=A0A183KZL6_9TREM|nr:unnamed protein product [Schistosoma curassoni]
MAVRQIKCGKAAGPDNIPAEALKSDIKVLDIHWSDTISNSLLWEGANQLPVEDELSERHWDWMEYTLWKSSNCITMHALTCNPEEKLESGKTMNTLCLELGAHIKSVNIKWKELERIAQGWMESAAEQPMLLSVGVTGASN